MKDLLPIIVTIVFALFTACSDDDCNDPRNESCSNFNPCLDTKPTRAGFKVEEKSWNYWIKCVTVYAAEILSAIRFTSENNKNSEHTSKIIKNN